MVSKREEMRKFIQRESRNAISLMIASMADRPSADTIRQHRESLANEISFHITEHYRFLELADIMEWKKTRTRR